jgi:hypothetical protein
MNAITPALQTAFDANRAAIRRSLPTGIASPDGCNVCGNIIEVRGYDCWACESAFNAPVRDTAALAAMLAHALEMRVAHEGGVS